MNRPSKSLQISQPPSRLLIPPLQLNMSDYKDLVDVAEQACLLDPESQSIGGPILSVLKTQIKMESTQPDFGAIVEIIDTLDHGITVEPEEAKKMIADTRSQDVARLSNQIIAAAAGQTFGTRAMLSGKLTKLIDSAATNQLITIASGNGVCLFIQITGLGKIWRAIGNLNLNKVKYQRESIDTEMKEVEDGIKEIEEKLKQLKDEATWREVKLRIELTGKSVDGLIKTIGSLVNEIESHQLLVNKYHDDAIQKSLEFTAIIAVALGKTWPSILHVNKWKLVFFVGVPLGAMAAGIYKLFNRRNNNLNITEKELELVKNHQTDVKKYNRKLNKFRLNLEVTVPVPALQSVDDHQQIPRPLKPARGNRLRTKRKPYARLPNGIPITVNVRID